MALIPGTLPTGATFPGTPQALLNLIASYLSAPPAKKALFVQPTSTGIPTDGTALWFNSTSGANTVNVYVSGTGWVTASVTTLSGSTISTGSLPATALVPASITASQIANNAITPGLLSTGGPSWDTSGNVTSAGTLTATAFYGSGANLTGLVTVPTGAVMPFAMNSAPTGWLACTGSLVSRVTYANLFTAIGTTYNVGDGSTTFGLPDLRGYFVRGSGTNADGTASGSFGAQQRDAFQGHEHNYTNSTYEGNFQGGPVGITANNVSATTAGIVSDGTNGTPRVAAETRPANIAMLYCIKT